jgi:hypothetical protein
MNKYLLTLLVFIILYFSVKKIENFKYSYKNNLNFTPKIAIQTVFILKENLPFLEEWIVYHKKIGIDKFYLYDNTGSFHRNNHKKINKRLMDYDKMISLSNNDVNKEMELLKKKYPEIVHVIWQPRDKNNNITYGQIDAIKHYIKNYGSACDFTAFTDLDEYIYLKKNKSLKDYIKNNINDKFIIQQTKMNDRFCGSLKNNNVLSNIETLDIKSQWAPKNIIKNSEINLDKYISIHNIPIKSNKYKNCSKDDLLFFHFNISKTEVNWIKKHFKNEKLNEIDNKTLKNFSKKNNINYENKFLNKEYIKSEKDNICFININKN